MRRIRRRRFHRQRRRVLRRYARKVAALQDSVADFQKAVSAGRGGGSVRVKSANSWRRSVARISANSAGNQTAGGQVAGSGPHHIYNVIQNKAATRAGSKRGTFMQRCGCRLDTVLRSHAVARSAQGSQEAASPPPPRCGQVR